MPVARSRSGRGSISERRQMVWATHTQGMTTVVAGTPGISDLLTQFETVYGAHLIGSTVTRIRGTITWQPTAVADCTGVFAIGVMPEATDANDVDPTASDSSYGDWMINYGRQFTGQQFATGAVIASQFREECQEFDLQAQRRIRQVNTKLALVTAATGTSVRIGWRLRILVKLP